jgi:hypothetical protein
VVLVCVLFVLFWYMTSVVYGEESAL